MKRPKITSGGFVMDFLTIHSQPRKFIFATSYVYIIHEIWSTMASSSAYFCSASSIIPLSPLRSRCCQERSLFGPPAKKYHRGENLLAIKDFLLTVHCNSFCSKSLVCIVIKQLMLMVQFSYSLFQQQTHC